VLVYDPRGSGNSEGTVNSYGWGWEKDAAAALDLVGDTVPEAPWLPTTGSFLKASPSQRG
jgi:alpha/beta superfamily hydrolase